MVTASPIITFPQYAIYTPTQTWKSGLYLPFLKDKKFCPNPIPKYGLPPEANIIERPYVEGTFAYTQFWDEQIDRCINGYKTGGVHITGRYYFYLNFCKISTPGRGYHYPDFCDSDLLFFEWIDWVKAQKKGGISFKGRRKGESEKFMKAVAAHGVLFTPEKYHAAIFTGEPNFKDEAFDKINELNDTIVQEYRLRAVKDNKDKISFGWEEKDSKGAWLDKGSRSFILARVTDRKPNIGKGSYFDDVFYEEAGENKVLKAVRSAVLPCLMVGDIMHGSEWVYGTGGKLSEASDDFKDIWYNRDVLNFEAFPFTGDMMRITHFVGSTSPNGKGGGEIVEDIPNVKAAFEGMDISPEQILGCEDRIRAKEVINNRLDELQKGIKTEAGLESFYQFKVDNCLTEQDAFLSLNSNDFNKEALSAQEARIHSIGYDKIKRYTLEIDKNERGEVTMPMKVTATLAPFGTPAWQTVQIFKHPDYKYQNLHFGGIDSYDQDKAMASTSLGAMVVGARKGNPYIDDEGVSMRNCRVPMALYMDRPPRKEQFYDMCFKIAIYYNLVRSTLVDFAKPGVIGHFNRAGGHQFMAQRPRKFESEHSKQSHDVGMLFTGGINSKQQVIGLLQTWVYEEMQHCWFIELLANIRDYDVDSKESDKDSADAWMLGLAHDFDSMVSPTGGDGEVTGSLSLRSYAPDMEYRVKVDNSQRGALSLRSFAT